MKGDLDRETRDFIDRYIDSVEQLEILLLLRETSPRGWTAAQVNDRLQSHLESVQERLSQLCRFGLIRCENGIHDYSSQLNGADETLGDLAIVYRHRRIRVIEWIFSRPKNKLRDFSDAFKIRKDHVFG